jgi:hypothetical protein
MLSVIMLCVILLSVITLTVMLSVVGPELELLLGACAVGTRQW